MKFAVTKKSVLTGLAFICCALVLLWAIQKGIEYKRWHDFTSNKVSQEYLNNLDDMRKSISGPSPTLPQDSK